jgi:hypothetical protein
VLRVSTLKITKMEKSINLNTLIKNIVQIFSKTLLVNNTEKSLFKAQKEKQNINSYKITYGLKVH